MNLWRKFTNMIVEKKLILGRGAQLVVTSDTGTQSTIDMAELAAIDSIGASDLAKIDGITNGTGAAGKALVLDSSGNVTIPAGGIIDQRAGEVVTATNVITAAENGKTFFLNSGTEFVSTLPAPAVGLRYTFVVTAAPASASYTVVTASSANVMLGHVVTSQDAGGSSDSETSGGDTLTFADGKAVVGDCAVFESDGTSWFVRASCKVFDAITITTAS